MRRFVAGRQPRRFYMVLQFRLKPLYWVSIVMLSALLCGLHITSESMQVYATTTDDMSPQAYAAVHTASSRTVAPYRAEYSAKLLFMGDTMLDRSVGASIRAGKDPFEYVKPILAQADMRIINIETTIASPAVAAHSASKPYTFNAPLQSLDTLKQADIDVSVLANNHTSDFGPAATTDMLKQFSERDMKTVGAGNTVDDAFAPLILQLPVQDGKRSDVITIGLIALNDVETQHTAVRTTRAGSAYFDENLIKQSIAKARQQGADLIVVMNHWGIEYTHVPTARQKTWAQFFIDNGADLVIGGHPHVTQPLEIYKEKQVLYSLGNFIFDGMDGDALKGQMAQVGASVRIDRKGNRQASFDPITLIPYDINHQGFPVPTH